MQSSCVRVCIPRRHREVTEMGSFRPPSTPTTGSAGPTVAPPAHLPCNPFALTSGVLVEERLALSLPGGLVPCHPIPSRCTGSWWSSPSLRRWYARLDTSSRGVCPRPLFNAGLRFFLQTIRDKLKGLHESQRTIVPRHTDGIHFLLCTRTRLKASTPFFESGSIAL